MVNQITIGNAVSWAVMVLTAGITYGILSTQVSTAVDDNKKNYEHIEQLSEQIGDLKIDLTKQNGDVMVIRYSVDVMSKKIEELTMQLKEQHASTLNVPDEYL